ncbi:MAG: RNA-binding protein [Oscillatoriales cyanobacterium SM2_2_1]|nr:RNA-binding protein [Oscillatoriales cyanobacterium SM2_2_1]
MSIRLYVGNLPAEVDRQALERMFHESGDSVSFKVITDRKTGKCRGFGFVTVDSDELADSVIEKFNGYDFNGAVLKLEKALPRTKGKSDDDDAVEQPAGEDEPAEATGGTEAGVDGIPKPSKRKKRNNKKPKTESSATTLESHQPDPRWANELEKLRQQLLASQNS